MWATQASPYDSTETVALGSAFERSMLDRRRSLVLRALRLWLPAAAVATVAAGLIYGEVQQDLRSSANDPQIQMAEDAAATLDGGASPDQVLPPGKVEIARSLAPYLMVFDKQGRLLASSATVDGAQPEYPKGVLDGVAAGRREEVTWQTASGVRSATVAVAYKNGFVVAGRSLRAVEERENNAELIAAAGWIGMLGATAMAALVAAFISARP
jgi:hypothetical protein